MTSPTEDDLPAIVGDGITDDAPAIQAYIDRYGHFPPIGGGTYLIGRPLTGDLTSQTP